MSKRCPECRNLNEDSRTFCAYCGATLDAELRLIQDLQKQTKRNEEAPSKQRGDVNFYTSHSAQKKKEKKSAAPWIILGLIAVAVVLWFVLR